MRVPVNSSLSPDTYIHTHIHTQDESPGLEFKKNPYDFGTETSFICNSTILFS